MRLFLRAKQFLLPPIYLRHQVLVLKRRTTPGLLVGHRQSIFAESKGWPSTTHRLPATPFDSPGVVLAPSEFSPRRDATLPKGVAASPMPLHPIFPPLHNCPCRWLPTLH